MWVNKERWTFRAVLILSMAALGTGELTAKVIAIEDEDAVIATPTPKPKAVAPAKAPEGASPKASEAASRVKAGTGDPVKMGEKIGFHYFVKSGFVVQDPQEVPSVGKVLGLNGQLAYSTPDKCKLEPADEGTLFRPGDRLVVYRVGSSIREKSSGFSGQWVQNLAILKVVESGEEGLLGEAVKTYAPFREGDRIKPYHEEMDRWNNASSQKELPSEPIRCFVAGGADKVENLTQADFVILTAGADEGVVEGMVLEIREPAKVGEAGGRSVPLGRVRVFFAGGNHSMAQVLHSSRPIRKGFEAHYQP